MNKHALDHDYAVDLVTGEVSSSKAIALDEWISHCKSMYSQMREFPRGSDQYKEFRSEMGYCLLQLRTLCRARRTGYKKALKEIGIIRKTANRWIKYEESYVRKG